jgi:AraC-like DNA-binding protein
MTPQTQTNKIPIKWALHASHDFKPHYGIEEIAAEAGFHSVARCNGVLRQMAGESPGRYRNLLFPVKPQRIFPPFLLKTKSLTIGSMPSRSHRRNSIPFQI